MAKLQSSTFVRFEIIVSAKSILAGDTKHGSLNAFWELLPRIPRSFEAR